MGVNGARADDQLFGDLNIGQALGHQAEDLELAGSQPGGG
jgi:hypothetical protein